MDKWQKLKGFLTDGKEHITKDFYVSRPSVFEEILDIMEELEKRELSNSDIAQWLLVEEHIEDGIVKQEFKCTHCGFTHTSFDGHTTQYKYCPSCGKRMKFIKMPNTGFTLYPN